jgi:NAD(P)-dependent dehydrogenase (short-subunit alcohol dehydrogenase family)
MKEALIWGASGGMGSAIARKLESSGWKVAAVTRSGMVKGFDSNHIFRADVGDPASVASVIESLREVSEEFDLFVYAIGDISAERVREQTPDTWNRIVNANLTGAYLTTHYSLPLLSKEAHMVFIGAVTEKLNRVPKFAAYAASKGGLESFITVLTREERKRRITLLRPGAVKTSFWDKMPLSLPEAALQPENVAEEVLNAYDSGHKGVLDL